MADSQNESKWGSRENFFGSTGITTTFTGEDITPSFVQAEVITPISSFIDKLQRINVIKPTDDSKQCTTLLIEKEREICAELTKTFQISAEEQTEVIADDRENASLKVT